MLDVRRVSLDDIMKIDMKALLLQFLAEGNGGPLSGKVRDHDGTDIQPPVLELGSKTKDVLVIGNADISTHLVFYDIFGTDDNHQLRQIAQLHQHLKLAVRRESGQHTRSVQVIKQFSPEFQIQFVAELSDPLPDVL